MPAPADADQAPLIGSGAQAVPVAPISQEHTRDAVDADGLDHR
jgi:hypothetical protein